MAPELSHFTSTDAAYPPALRLYLCGDAPAILTTQGDLNILHAQQHRPLFALFCSIQCPPALILQTYELAQVLRDAGVTVISGFHSPMEKECLSILLQGTQPVILCPARSLERISISNEKKTALEQGRLLFLTPFTTEERRPTTNRAQERNVLVAALADIVFITHATPGGKTEKFCKNILAWKKPVLTLDSHENAHLFSLGINVVRPEQIGKQGDLFVENEGE
jgi:predicted Rossmann fold nucleotide-binding protein DprA/Smf involved in DNA uptake